MAQYFGDSNSIFIFRLVLIITSLFGVLASNLTDFFPKFEHFSTKNGNSIVFLVVGDWGRGGYFNQSRVANQMGDVGKKLDIDFVISTGDNFYDEGLKSADDPAFKTSFTNVYTATSLQKPWYIVLGNHDYRGNTEVQTNQELKRIDDRWHSRRNFIVEAGFVDIFFIDTTPFVDVYFVNPKKQNFDWNEILPRKRYLSTVRKNLDLAVSRSKAPWKIVVGHHTIRSIGHHGDTKEIIDQLLPILEAHKVDMYINGHDHCLQHLSNRKGSMQFLTSGGGSKAWKNDIHYGIHNETMHFYYDGQGFMSVTITRDKGKVVFYDASGKSLYDLKLKTLEHRYFRG